MRQLLLAFLLFFAFPSAQAQKTAGFYVAALQRYAIILWKEELLTTASTLTVGAVNAASAKAIKQKDAFNKTAASRSQLLANNYCFSTVSFIDCRIFARHIKNVISTRMELDFNLFTLPNGIRVIHQQVGGSDVSHCGIIVNAGSRDETESEQGLAHFIEHSIFKGTKKRKAYHILSGLDAVGGELNAYTTKEETAVYASFQNQYLDKAIELITDITFNSTFETKEINKEKDVIIDEINSYLDSPGEQIYDDFEEQIFANHSIGRNILGTIESVKSFKRKDVLSFMKRHFTTDRMVFSVVGAISEKRLRRMIDKHLANIPASTSELNRTPFQDYKVSKKENKEEHYQTHVMIGCATYGSDDPKRRSLILLNNILGGPAMNSRLNLGIREKYGFAYNIESSYTPYSDTGLFSVYFGTDSKVSDRTHRLVMNELKKFRDKKLGVRQLEQAKKQLIGQIALSQENRVSSMLSLGKSVIFYDTVDPLSETYRKIHAITAEEVLQVANEVLAENMLSSLVFPGR